MERNAKSDGNSKKSGGVDSGNYRNPGQKKKRNTKLFWGSLLGTLITIGVLSFSINYLYGKLERKVSTIEKRIPQNTTVENKTKELLSTILGQIEQHRSEYLQKALKLSIPQLEQLTEDYEKELNSLVDKSLDEYFQQYVYPSEDEFVNWIYSLKTQYLLLFYKGGDLAKSGWQKVKHYACEKLVNKLPQFVKNHLCGNDLLIQNATLKAEEYFSEHFERILIKPDKLQKFLKEDLTPKVEELCRNYISQVEQIVKENLRKVIKEELKNSEGINLPEKELNQLTEMATNLVLETTGGNLLSQLKHPIAAAGGITGAVFVYKILTKKILAEESERLAAKLAATIVEKLAAKEGLSEALRIATGAATSALTCSWMGPIGAAVCGVIGGVITWIFGDYVLNKIDYYLNHREVKKELHTTLVELKEKLAESVAKNYSRCFSTVLLTVKEIESKGLTIKELSSP